MSRIASPRRLAGMLSALAVLPFPTFASFASLAPAALAQQPAGHPTGARQKIERADELPRHVYRVRTTALALVQNDSEFAELSRSLASDMRADLESFDIRDRATLRAYYATFSDLAMDRGDYKTAAAWRDSIRAMADKPGTRYMIGLMERAFAGAADGRTDVIDTGAFRASLRRGLAALPFDSVKTQLAQMRSTFELGSPSAALGTIQARIEPAARSGSISRELAEQLVRYRVSRRRIDPVRTVIREEFARTIAARSIEKTDIWAARDVSLDGRAGLTPVVVGIWDTGVDVSVFPNQLFTNTHEIPSNGKDDDGNGYVDDVHGIAHDLDGNRSTGVLFNLSLTPAEETEYRGLAKGNRDIQAGLETPEAAAFKRMVAGTAPADIKSLQEKLREYGVWSHGTHVAGIAVRGNPAARILVVRNATDEYKVPPRPLDLDVAAGQARELREDVAYLREHGARVVNMSWGIGPDFVERNLEANNVGKTAEERRELAHRIFDVEASALHEAMAAAPDILFVVAAGNWNSDNQFAEFVPAAWDLPNMITTAAVDRAGDEAAFTSYGKVDVYANGVGVSSQVPGGFVVNMSGTSMASPQVVNLAAKLLAVNPKLTVTELRRAIIDAADEKTIGPGKRIRLLNPRAAMERMTR